MVETRGYCLTISVALGRILSRLEIFATLIAFWKFSEAFGIKVFSFSAESEICW